MLKKLKQVSVSQEISLQVGVYRQDDEGAAANQQAGPASILPLC